jgi:hypothetical protein
MVRDPVGFSPIRRRILVGFYAHGSDIGANLVSSGFVGPILILLNPDSIPVVTKPKLK